MTSVGRHRVIAHKPHASVTTAMTLDAALSLSVEQLITALNKKIFMECTRVQSTISPISRALVPGLTAEVRSSERKKNY